MRKSKLLIPLLLFAIGGIYGIFSIDFIQINQPIYNWFIILAFLIGIYYAFSLISNNDKNKSDRTALRRIAITILVTMLVFRTTQGYIILYNCNIGKQTEIYVKGEVTELKFPALKRIFGKNSIDIFLSDKLEKITLEVPTSHYYVGQTFEKNMNQGSLGILYSSK